MRRDEYAKEDATGLAALIRQGAVSAAEVAAAAADAIEALNPALNCVIERLAPDLSGPREGPFHGVPTLIKDFPMVRGMRAEMGSQLVQGFVCQTDSNLWKNLREAGFVNLGRTTTSEFGINAVTETRACGITRNPWELSRSVAGSSGGAAAAVASGMVPVAHGSDAGGSIRNPAAFCGLVGLKPSRGRVSNAPGLVSGLGGVSHNFMLTRTVRDCAALLDVLAGPCGGDFMELPAPAQTFTAALTAPARGLRIALAKESWSPTPIAADVATAISRTAYHLESLGHHIDIVTAPFDYAEFMAAQKTIWAVNTRVHITDVARAMAREPGPENLQTTSWALYEAGRHVTGEAYAGALRVAGKISRQVAALFEGFDLFMSPTALITAEPVMTVNPDLTGATIDDVYDQLEAKETFTAPFNITGHPAISLPVGLTKAGLPVGAQLVAGFGQDALLLQIAAALENGPCWIKDMPGTHLNRLGGQ
jgi:amidase